MTRTMLAIEISTPGAAAVLQPVARAMPEAAAGQVLLQVHAAGVNRPDVFQRKGMYPPPPGASDIPGLEVAGTVSALGKGVDNLSIGDAVCALLSGGGYAQYCVAESSLCLKLPQGFSMLQGAALPETFFTVWSNVFDRGQLRPAETLLVHGGASGIGTTAIQLAQAFGAKVYTTAGSDEKCKFCLGIGADAAINYRDEDFAACIDTLTGGKGVDVILDMIGGDYFPRNLKCLADDGRLLQIAVQNGPKTELNLLPVLLKRLTITGSTLRPRPVAFKAAIAEELRRQVWPLLAGGRIMPVIHATFPLEHAAQAHALMESGAHIGKIILTVSP
jgi:NADPH:quinone reductase